MGISGIGYEGLAVDDLVSRLRMRGVVTLVDVRLNAMSRKRGFSKKALAAALEESGINYLHLPALGNLRDNRDGYGQLESLLGDEARARYRATLRDEQPAQALRQVAGLAKQEIVAVFCYEEDERHCHREQVLDEVHRIIAGDLVGS